MPRDYKHRKVKKKQPTPGWIWGLGGLAIGLTRRAVGAPAGSPERTPCRTRGQRRRDSVIGRDEEKLVNEKPKKRFDFYDMLPRFEVVIPETETEVSKGGAETAPVPTGGIYVLQAGSFRAFADADRMKARLALQGLQAQIQKVTIDDKRWHRVRHGTFYRPPQNCRKHAASCAKRISTFSLFGSASSTHFHLNSPNVKIGRFAGAASCRDWVSNRGWKRVSQNLQERLAMQLIGSG